MASSATTRRRAATGTTRASNPDDTKSPDMKAARDGEPTVGSAAEELAHEHPAIKERPREGALARHDRHPTESELIQAAADGKTFPPEQLDHVGSPVGLPTAESGDPSHIDSEGPKGFARKEAAASAASAKKKSPEAKTAKPLKAASPAPKVSRPRALIKKLARRG